MTTISFLPRSSAAVANTFLQLALMDRTPRDQMPTALRLQRLVYLAHGYSLAILSSRLVADPVVALDTGPIFPALRDATAIFEAAPILSPVACRDRAGLAHAQGVLVDRVWLKYGQLDEMALHDFVYEPDTPWAATAPYLEIEPSKIAAFFAKRAA
ncbi:MAG TPA: DUF4065 domain-containing protein [Beijerinckiaceae bacterium]|nr:DUF4065 domain-containing protein [Rhodoblastus sp.]HRY03862.1 DUF4065 domain-containing protein [Beijerinckiaceae bacterium]